MYDQVYEFRNAKIVNRVRQQMDSHHDLIADGETLNERRDMLSVLLPLCTCQLAEHPKGTVAAAAGTERHSLRKEMDSER